MTDPISSEKHGDVQIIWSDNPPVNALGAAVRQGLVREIEAAEADDSVNAVVIACKGRTFFAGADISEFGKPPVMPWLPDVVDRIEACTKPVVAAIHGIVRPMEPAGWTRRVPHETCIDPAVQLEVIGTAQIHNVVRRENVIAVANSFVEH